MSDTIAKPSPVRLAAPTSADAIAAQIGAEVADQVFITPRVLDRGAFDEYAEGLKSLIREAAGRGQSLQTAMVDVKSMGDNLRQATDELKKRLETTVKIMPVLEQRLGKAEQVLQLAASETKLAEHFEKTLSRMLAEHVARLEARIGEVVTGAEQRLNSLFEVAQGRTQTIDAQAQAQAQTRINELQDRLATMSERTISRAEATQARLIHELDETLKQATALRDELNTRGEAWNTQLSARFTESQQRAETLDRQLAQRAESIVGHASQQLQEIAQRSGMISQEFSAKADGLQARLRALTNEAEARAKSLGTPLNQLQQKIESQLGDAQARVSAIAGPTLSKLEALQAQMQALANNNAGELRRQAASLQNELSSHGESLRSRLTGEMESLENRLSKASAEVDTRLKPIADATRQLIAELDQRIAKVRFEFEAAAGPTLARLDTLCLRAAEVMNEATQEGSGTVLQSLLAKADQLRLDAIDAASGFGAIRDQVEIAKRDLSQLLLSAAEDMDRQHARQQSLLENMNASAGDLDRLWSRHASLQGAIDESIVLAETAAKAVAGQAMAIRSASKAVEARAARTSEALPASQPNTITSTSQAEPLVPAVSTTASAAAPSNVDAPPATPGGQSIAGTVETEQGATHHVDSSTPTSIDYPIAHDDVTTEPSAWGLSPEVMRDALAETYGMAAAEEMTRHTEPVSTTQETASTSADRPLPPSMQGVLDRLRDRLSH
ncbi:MAG: hypothetical protein IT432_11175 [Phycisphaerales bacterium]|nr:hypothetical protein [Phycisphaerales bacterium]